MKFKLYSLSALAIAALMTACSTDDEIVQNPVATAEVGTPAISVNLDELATRGFVSEKGAWTNFKANENNVGDNYDARVTLMVYAVNNGTAKDVTPIAIAPAQYLTQAEAAASGDQIKFESLRVPAGASYTAVAYVDFVGKDHADKFYNVANLSNVKQLLNAQVENGSTDAELRDAYTGQVTFTLSSDGTLSDATVDAEQVKDPNGTDAPETLEGITETITGAQATVTTLNILARRHFAKVRVVLTDYKTKAEWAQYFAGEDPSRAWNAEAMQIKNLTTQFNAVAQEPITDEGVADKVFVSEYDYQLPTVNWVQPQIDGAPATVATLDEVLATKGMKGVSVDYTALADDDVVFPVLSYNYFVPANTKDAAVYDIDFAALSKQGTSTYTWSNSVTEEPSTADWKTLMVRHINSVPVVKNTLTTIWGNFLTVETPMFLVTINDVFDNEIDRVLLADDSTTKTIITIAGVLVEINRDADGNIVSVDVDKNENEIKAENYDELVEGLQDLKNWVDTSVLNIYFNEYLKDNDDFLPAVDIAYIHLIAEGTLADDYTNTISDNLWITSDKDQPNITIVADGKQILVDGAGQYSDLDLKAKTIALDAIKTKNVKTEADDTYILDSNIDGTLDVTGDADIDGTEVTGKTNINGNAAVSGSTFGDDVKVTGNVTGNGDTFKGNVTIDGNATISNSDFKKDVTVGGKAVLNTDNIDGNLTVADTATLTDTNVKGNTQLNGTGNKIYGGTFDGTVNSEGTLTIADGTFNSEVAVKDALTVNDGLFNDNVRAFADATFNGGTVKAGKFIYMETAGTTLTLNAVVGNISPGLGVNATEVVNVTGTEVDATDDASGTGYYSRTRLSDVRFKLQ